MPLTGSVATIFSGSRFCSGPVSVFIGPYPEPKNLQGVSLLGFHALTSFSASAICAGSARQQFDHASVALDARPHRCQDFPVAKVYQK